MNRRSFLFSALLTGLVLGILDHIPLLSFLNFFLCMWEWLGGILAVFLYKRYEHGEGRLTVGQGAGLGALAGVIGALVATGIYLVTSFISPLKIDNRLLQALNVDLPFQMSGLQWTLTSTFVLLIIDILLYPIFGALGGLLGAGVFWRKPQVGDIRKS